MAGRLARPERAARSSGWCSCSGLIALNVTVFELPGNPDQVPGVMIGLVLAAFASFLPLRYWDRWGGPLSTPPGLPGASTWCSTSRSSPTSARRARSSSTRSARRCWPGCCSGPGRGRCSAAGCWSATTCWSCSAATGCDELRAHEARDIQALVVLPALYPLAAAGGAAVRGAARPPGRDPGRAGQRRAPRGGRGRARARRARDARLAGQDALRHRARGARRSRTASSARRRAPPPTARDLAAAAQVAAEEARGPDLRPALGHARPAAGRRAGALRARVVGAQRDRARTCRPTASTCRIRARATSSSASSARRWRTSSATPAPTQVEVQLRDVAPDVVLCVADDGVGIDGAATRARCRPTATTG